MADLKTNAHLFRYDTTYGIYPGKVESAEGVMKIDGQSIAVLNQKEPARLPWKQLGVDIVIEATGVFTDGAQVRAHLEAGAKKAIITAPATNEDITLVLGVNDSPYNPRKHQSSPTLRARPIVSRRWQKCCTTPSASNAA